MEKLPLYPLGLPAAGLGACRVSPFDADCRKCALRDLEPEDRDRRTGEVRKEARRARVVPPEASAGEGPTLLVVGEGPGRAEEMEGRPFVGPSGAKLRAMLRKGWGGRVVLELATKCVAGKREVLEEHVEACRPHVAATAVDVKPDRILALGDAAVLSVLGREVSVLTTRRGYAWVKLEGRPVPVFWALSPRRASPNRFLWKYLEEDVAWALQAQMPPPAHVSAVTSLVQTREDAAEACAQLRRHEGVSFDLEWAGSVYGDDLRLLCLSASGVGDREMAVWTWDEAALAGEAFGPLRALLEDPEVPKGGANVKSDRHAVLSALGVRVHGVTFDTRLERKLLEPEAPATLDAMQELVGMGGGKSEVEEALERIEARISKLAAGGKKKTQSAFDFTDAVDAAARLGFDVARYADNPRGIAYAFVEREMLLRYNARDALSTARLESLLSLRLARAPERARVWDRVVAPAASAVQRVEEWGVPFDAQAGQFFRQLSASAMQASYDRVQKYRPGINANSPDQLADLLYRELGLRCAAQTETGKESTSEEALAEIAHQHPVVGDLLEYRHHQKLVGYADDWLRCVRPDGRIHPSILLDGARSGRTSCADPNLQNIPRADTDDGKRARDCFVAPRGYVFVQLDYSQLELRVAAYIARDAAMADLFRSGVDFHLGTAKLISKVAWGIEPDAVTKAHRTGAKAYNFGLAYGKTDRTMAAELGISEEQAAQIRAAIFGKFVAYARWMREATAYAMQHGGCWTYWEDERGRWRPLWRIADDREEARGQKITAKNGAVNSPIQGTASELCVASITRVVGLIEAGQVDAQLVLPVHDSLMLVAPEKSWRDAALAAREAMMSYPWVTRVVPLEVDVEVGTKWGSLEKVKL